MLEPDSRYYELETTTIQTSDGVGRTYKKRRFLPGMGAREVSTEITVTQGERLDLIAARVFGNAEQFWHLCDANLAMNPFDLMNKIGTKLKVALPQGVYQSSPNTSSE